MKYGIRYELMERNGFCRGCDREMVKDKDKAIKFHSCRNNGQNIILCVDCIEQMNMLIPRQDIRASILPNQMQESDRSIKEIPHDWKVVPLRALETVYVGEYTPIAGKLNTTGKLIVDTYSCIHPNKHPYMKIRMTKYRLTSIPTVVKEAFEFANSPKSCGQGLYEMSVYVGNMTLSELISKLELLYNKLTGV